MIRGSNGSDAVRILVVDDHRTFGQLMSRALDAEDDMVCVGWAASSQEALAKSADMQPDVVLMDLHLPDIDGITTTAALMTRCPRVRVLILTADPSPLEVQRAGRAGASGFLAKDGSLEDVLDAIRTAQRGSIILPHGLLERQGAAGAAGRAFDLTQRELQILGLMGQGYDPRGISREIGISLHTCRGHIKSVLAKLDAHSQLEAVVLASRAGLIRIGA